ncbi:peptidylprolyl isomerase [uncultured Algibacter sp.]|uniref:peptidylprolyl isomerase n=1 Tax=uncultured Algibacter sp. TaxID=298659 RepID=UPI00262A8465|nr:peptidylprolyl isomerase [uncultured Algibacter sp.]
MLKNILLYLFIITSSLASSQNSIEKDLDSVTSFEKAQEYLKTKTFKKNKFIVFNEEKHKTTIAKDLLKLGLGGTKTYENDYEKTVYKVIEKAEIPSYRASYIYLDGTKHTSSKIEAIQKTIIRKYKDGAGFGFLAKQYSMDASGKRGGDSGWFAKSDYNTAIQNLIINDDHGLDAIFKAEITSKNAYYVILKTFEPKSISEIKVLKIIDDIE